MPNQHRARPRGRQILPTKREVQAYLALLRAKAQEGDVQAAAELIRIHERHEAQSHV